MRTGIITASYTRAMAMKTSQTVRKQLLGAITNLLGMPSRRSWAASAWNTLCFLNRPALFLPPFRLFSLSLKTSRMLPMGPGISDSRADTEGPSLRRLPFLMTDAPEATSDSACLRELFRRQEEVNCMPSAAPISESTLDHAAVTSQAAGEVPLSRGRGSPSEQSSSRDLRRSLWSCSVALRCAAKIWLCRCARQKARVRSNSCSASDRGLGSSGSSPMSFLETFFVANLDREGIFGLPRRRSGRARQPGPTWP
mmetsp:Transcript_45591/g.145461  ORF Transcript_45591/g.145461 Transcript_45591/m.145461 type:complete len:254 (+) Transcript_45591:2229-2990(+)